MSNNESNISVELPSAGDATAQRMAALSPYLLDATERYPEPYYMLEYNGVPFSTIGGIQALSGQKKNGKTFLLAQLMAAVLGTGSERVGTFLPGLRVPVRTIERLGHLPTVLYVDTEMEKLNTAKVLRRVHWLCGWQMDVPSERFHVLWLRSVTDQKTADGRVKQTAARRRYEIIKEAIEVLSPDAVFIDGIRDIIGDFNDNAESSSLITDLMALAEQHQLCIWSTLHMNPRMKNDDDSKMRGHLGTELGNKVTDTLVCVKHKQNGQVWFSVRQDDARGKDMDDWEFVVTDSAGALGVPQMRTVNGSAEQQRRQEADDYFSQYHWTSVGATYTDLERWLHTKGVTSNRKIGDLFNAAMETGVIYRSDKKKYHYRGISYTDAGSRQGDLPFSKPDNKDDLPY